MLKPKFKILLSILLVLLLVTSYCLATEEPATKELDTTEVEVTTTGEENPQTTGQAEAVPSDQAATVQDWVYEDLFKIEDTVKMDNIIDGNAFIIGKDVTISGEIGGDLFVIADKLTIDGGYVYSSIFALANEITINGSIYDLYAACDTFNLGNNGSIYRDMKLTASNADIAGRVRRNAYITAQKLSLAENAGELISGNLNYTGPNEAIIPEGVVAGEVNFSQAKPTENTGNSPMSYVLSLVESVLFTFVVTLLLLWLAPKFVERVSNTSGSKVLAALGIGLIAPICVAIVCSILFVSVIGMPISVCAMFIFLALAFAAKAITSVYFGKLLTNKMKAEGNAKLVLYTLLAAVILWVITKIPVIGGIVGFLAAIFGIGLVVINLFKKKETTEVVE